MILAIIVLAVVLVAALGGYYYYANMSSPSTMTTESTMASTTAASSSPVLKTSLKIALLLPGEKNDLSFNEAGYVAFLKMVDDLNSTGKYDIQVSIAEGLYTPEDAKPAIQSLGTQGYNFILANGYQYTPPAIDAAATYPNTGFLIVGGYEWGKNVGMSLPATGEAGFLLGVLAALHSRTGKVGVIGGENVAEITWNTEGFKLGVAYANQNFGTHVTALVTFIGNFNDPAAAKAAAASDVSQGADILFCTGDGISIGTAAEAQAANVGFMYVAYNETSLAPANTLGGETYSAAPVFEQAFNDWTTNGSFSSLPYYLTLQNHGLSLDLTSQVRANETVIINNLQQGVIDGKIRVYSELSNGTLVWSPLTPSYSSLG